MAAKIIILDWSETGKTVYCIVRREVDSFRLNDADGSFASAPADPYLSLAEDGVIKGRYEVSESRTVWDDGDYTATIYKQASGSPVPANDQVIGSWEARIENDTIVVQTGDNFVPITSLLEGLVMQATTIATLASQTSFTLTAGSSDNDAYNGATIVVVDATTGEQKAFGSLSDYTGSSKTVTLAQDPGIFTMAVGDKVYILPSDVFAIWDRSLTGATHNEPTSAGRRLRQLAGSIMSDGTAQAGGPNTITLAAGESAIDRIYWQSYIAIVDGTGAGQGHHILSYNGTTKVAIIDDNWTVPPDATSDYVIIGAGSHDEYESGLAQAGSANTITLESSAVGIDDTHINDFIVVVSGTGRHQTRRIIDYDGTTKIATVMPNWTVNPDATSGYWIHGQGYPNVWDEVLNKTTHNEGQSSGKRLRQLGDLIAEDASINDASPTDTSFITTLTSTVDDLYVDEVLVIVDDASLTGQSRVISAYDGTTKRVTVDEPFSLIPVNGSDFIIFTPHVHPVTQIAEAVRDVVLEGGLSWGEITRIMAAALAGELAGGGTATLTFTGLDGTTIRIVTTRDDSGNRTLQVLDGT